MVNKEKGQWYRRVYSKHWVFRSMSGKICVLMLKRGVLSKRIAVGDVASGASLVVPVIVSGRYVTKKIYIYLAKK